MKSIFYTIKKDYNNKKNIDIWVLKITTELEYADFLKLKKELSNIVPRAYYSRYAKGFVFEQEPNKTAIANLGLVESTEETVSISNPKKKSNWWLKIKEGTVRRDSKWIDLIFDNAVEIDGYEYSDMNPSTDASESDPEKVKKLAIHLKEKYKSLSFAKIKKKKDDAFALRFHSNSFYTIYVDPKRIETKPEITEVQKIQSTGATSSLPTTIELPENNNEVLEYFKHKMEQSILHGTGKAEIIDNKIIVEVASQKWEIKIDNGYLKASEKNEFAGMFMVKIQSSPLLTYSEFRKNFEPFIVNAKIKDSEKVEVATVEELDPLNISNPSPEEIDDTYNAEEGKKISDYVRNNYDKLWSSIEHSVGLYGIKVYGQDIEVTDPNDDVIGKIDMYRGMKAHSFLPSKLIGQDNRKTVNKIADLIYLWYQKDTPSYISPLEKAKQKANELWIGYKMGEKSIVGVDYEAEQGLGSKGGKYKAIINLHPSGKYISSTSVWGHKTYSSPIEALEQGIPNMINVYESTKTNDLNIIQEEKPKEITKNTKYKTWVDEFPNNYSVRVDIGDESLIPKIVSSYTLTEEGKEQAIKFAKNLADKNRGVYDGFYGIKTDKTMSEIDDFVKSISAEPINLSSESYKNQKELNDAIIKFIEQTKDKDINSFSNEEKEFIYQYEGSGGLIKEGAEDEGVLTEFYTPDLLIRKMWALAYKFGFSGGKILENSVGVGRFLDYVNYQRDKVLAYEKNEISARICKIVHPFTDVRVVETFAQHFYGQTEMTRNIYNPNFEKDFDLVIGNPPYGEYKDRKMVSEESINKIKYQQLEFYFTLRGLDCLKSGGLLVYVVPSNIFTAESKYDKIQQAIENKAELLDAYLLPEKTFAKTKIATCIIVLRKK